MVTEKATMSLMPSAELSLRFYLRNLEKAAAMALPAGAEPVLLGCARPALALPRPAGALSWRLP